MVAAPSFSLPCGGSSGGSAHGFLPFSALLFILTSTVMLPHAQAACVVPLDVVTQGISCQTFDSSSDTIVTMWFDDANLQLGPGYIQLGATSNPNSGYSINDIGLAPTNIATGFQPLTTGPDSLTTGYFDYADINPLINYDYTYIQADDIVKPTYFQVTIVADASMPLGSFVSFIFVSNRNNAATAPTSNAPDGVLIDQQGNGYVSITRTLYNLPPTKSPTTTPSSSPSETPTSQPSARPTLQPSQQPTLVPSASPTLSPTTAFPTSAPTRTPVTPLNCYDACAFFFQNETNPDQFYFNLYMEYGTEICGCCKTCETQVPIDGGIVYVTTDTSAPTFTPTATPSLQPTRAPTPSCDPIDVKVKSDKIDTIKYVKEGKKFRVIALLKNGLKKKQRRSYNGNVGVDITLPNNVTFIDETIFLSAKDSKRKGTYTVEVEGNHVIIYGLTIKEAGITGLMLKLHVEEGASGLLRVILRPFYKAQPDVDPRPCYAGSASEALMVKQEGESTHRSRQHKDFHVHSKVDESIEEGDVEM